MAALNPPLCDFGLPAINATLPGTDGKDYTLFDLAGPKGLVIAFICNHCPYVKAVAPKLVRDAKDLWALGIGFVAINANDADAYPDDSFDNMVRFGEQHRFPFPYLQDASQDVARAYAAICTPDFFGYNGKLELQYRGRLDASRAEPGPADLKRELYEAMRQVAETGQGPKDQIASVGCSLKWKAEV